MPDNYGTNLRAPKVNIHDFSMVPRIDIPRSSFRMQNQHKTTFSASKLVPVYVQEVLPGDSFSLNMTAFCRLATPLFPIMDNMDLESWFFFVPNRIMWIHWVNFMGEQVNPSDSISFNVPQVVSPVGGFPVNTIFDYFGLPTAGQTGAGNTISVNALPLRAYNKIYNQWFRDENQNLSFTENTGDGPDNQNLYTLATVNKRHDYFTACLPWTQKGGAITTPLAGTAIVKTSTTPNFTGAQAATQWLQATGSAPSLLTTLTLVSGTNANMSASSTGGQTGAGSALYPSNLYADLSTATATTINALRLAFQTQRLLERDARAGTRYTEIIRSHFGVISPDMRLQRPEYLGGGKTPINITPVPQTTATGLTGGTTPLGTLAAAGTGIARHGFRQSFTEHGYIIGLVTVRQDMGYQQGIRKLWSRQTRYDFYLPVFQALGEQAVLNQEIYSDGSANDALTFGFQERWAEYRYAPSYTSGFFRSTSPTPLDAWHLVEKFTTLPTLNANFLADTTTLNLQRAQAAGAAAQNQQILADLFFDVQAARPMPMYSVPGMIDHF